MVNTACAGSTILLGILSFLIGVILLVVMAETSYDDLMIGCGMFLLFGGALVTTIGIVLCVYARRAARQADVVSNVPTVVGYDPARQGMGTRQTRPLLYDPGYRPQRPQRAGHTAQGQRSPRHTDRGQQNADSNQSYILHYPAHRDGSQEPHNPAHEQRHRSSPQPSAPQSNRSEDNPPDYNTVMGISGSR